MLKTYFPALPSYFPELPKDFPPLPKDFPPLPELLFLRGSNKGQKGPKMVPREAVRDWRGGKGPELNFFQKYKSGGLCG